MGSLVFLFLWLAANLTAAHSAGSFRGSITSKSRKLVQGFVSSFPSVTRDLHPEALKLKAHSSIHLGDKDPEIFVALEAVFTPYLQEILGESLVAYDLEILYGEGEDTEVENIVVTNMLVTCVLTVRSGSAQELQLHTHDKADTWFYEFFDGTNVFKFLANLREKNIDVNEIVFQDEEFRSPLLNGGEVVSEVNSDGISSGSSNKPQPESSGGQGGAIAGAFVGVLVVCGVLLVRYKEKIPWHLVQDMTMASETSLDDSDASKKPGSRGRRLSAALKKKIPSSQAIKKKLPSSEGIKKKLPSANAIKQKIYSPVRRAAIQKKPAFSSDYPAEPKNRQTRPTKKNPPVSLLDSNPYNPFNSNSNLDPPPSDISFSVDGDYDIPEEYDFSVRSPTISSYSGARVTTPVVDLTGSEDEFSMPDDYNTVNDDYSVHCHSILGLVDQPSLLDDSRSVASRRAGMPPPASPYFSNSNTELLDEWSIDGYSDGYSLAAAKTSGGAKSGLDLPPLR